MTDANKSLLCCRNFSRTIWHMRHGVILAGGGGTRLWPASRRGCPKQFRPFGTGQESLLAATARRLRPVCNELLWVVAPKEQQKLVAQVLGGTAATQITEPVGRNTAPALGLAALHLVHRDADAVLAAVPSDQHIGDETEFLRVLELGFRAAEEHDAIVTVGVVPTRPETGFGYLELGDALPDPWGQLSEVSAFIEKPDAATAQRYLDSGRYRWNAGMFIVRATWLLAEIRRLMPDLASGLDEIAEAMSHGPKAAQQVCEKVYPRLPAISIDYGVMERTQPVFALSGDFGWNDVGAWSAVADYTEGDPNGNVLLADAVLHEATGNIVQSDPGTGVALAGVDNLVVVQSGNAVLVVPKERAQDVRFLVKALKDNGMEQYL